MRLKKFLTLLRAICLRCYYGRQIVLCCIANIASIGGNELQFRLVSSNLKQRKLSNVVIILGDVKTDNLLVSQVHQQGIAHLQFTPCSNEYFLAMVFRVLGVKMIKIFNPASAIVVPSAKRVGLRVIYMETGVPGITDPFWDKLKPYINHIDYVVSVSKCALLILQNEFGYRGLSKIIPSMIEPPPVGHLARHPVAGQFNVIYFGRLCPTKQLDQLIKALALIRKKFPFIHLTLIGEGDARNSLKKEVADLGLSEHVTWQGWLSREKLFEALTVADLFCLPSRSEGNPCSIAESMAIGLTVLASNVGGIPEAVIHRKTGLLFQVNDVESLAAAIIELIQCPKFKLQLGKQGFLHYHQRRTQQQIFTELLDIYKTFI